ncbi:MAG: FtsX-like permease family protein [Candidatus Heimdallarchaeota archaeon]|nr:FtsX-like permease family protein [Candidatus Heimdallarchaeota archaeon]MBY8994213.1 FtsX-like permease family protein [Candidatus Heimdallarchaeota archaeon]
MQQIYKTIFREFRFQKKRTFLLFLVFFVIVSFPLAMFSIDPSINASVKESNESFKLTYLDMGFQGNVDEVRSSIEDLIATNSSYSGVSYEIRPSSSYQLYHEANWFFTSVIGINTTAPPVVNQLDSEVAFSKLRNDTAFILESFAKELDVEIGDSVTLYTLAGVKEVEIVGLVKSIEFLSYDLSLEGAIYVNYNTFQAFNGWAEIQFNSLAFYFPNEPDLDLIKAFTEDLSDEVDPMEAQITYSWYVREFSISSLFQDVLNLTSKVLFVMACAIILGAGIVIYLITKRYAVEQRKQTGMLYAFGYQPKIILRVFMLRTLIISLISIAIGILGSYGILEIMVRILISRWGIPTILTRFSPLALVLVPALVIVSSQIFTYFACRSNVKMTPYEAIRGKTEIKIKTKTNKSNGGKRAQKSLLSTSFKYPIRNLSRNRARGVLITSAFIGAIAISFALIQTQTSINGTFDNYFNDQIHWDVQTRFDSYKSEAQIASILDNFTFIKNYEPYLHSGAEVTDTPDYGLEIRGLQPNSSLFSLSLEEGVTFSNATAQEGIISSYSAKPLELEIGDYFNFSLLGVEFQIEIVGIVRDLDVPNSCFMLIPAINKTTGFSAVNNAFIQLDNMESLDSDDLDSILLELNEDTQIQYAITKDTYEDRMVHMVNTQLFIVKVTIILALIISFLIIFVTAFVSILERTREIALQRTFGFQKFQIFNQLILEMGMLIFLAVLFGIAVGGEGLGRMIQFFISQFFFKLDTIYFWGDYLLIVGFAAGCVLLSTLPSINLLQKQKLATAIIE